MGSVVQWLWYRAVARWVVGSIPAKGVPFLGALDRALRLAQQ